MSGKEQARAAALPGDERRQYLHDDTCPACRAGGHGPAVPAVRAEAAAGGPPYMLANTPEEFERVRNVAAERHAAEVAQLRARDAAAGGELRDRLGRPAVLPGSPREQVREAIRRELVAWGYAELPVQSLSTDLTGAVFRLAVVRRALDGEDGDRG